MKFTTFDRVFGFILAILTAAFLMLPWLLIDQMPNAKDRKPCATNYTKGHE